jgi:HK97 family phage prohead protease
VAPAAAQTVDLPLFSRLAELQPRSFDEKDLSVDVVFSTGAPVMRTDWWTGKKYVERLSMDPKAVRLDRLNNGGPLLDSHSSWDIAAQIGVVVDDSAKVDGKKAVARVRFSQREKVRDIVRDVKDKIVRNVSVGYIIHKFEETTGEDGSIPVRTATDWEPYEISLVPMPADAAAQVRSGKAVPTHPCEYITRTKEPVMEPTAAAGEQTAAARIAETIAENSPLRPDPPAQPPPASLTPNDVDRGRAAERARVQGIRNACEAARMPRELERQLIDSDLTLEECQTRILDELKTRGGQDVGPSEGATRGRVEIAGQEDPLVHARAGIVEALLHRIDAERVDAKGQLCFPLTDNGRRYRGMTILDIGRAFLNARGTRTTMMTRSQLVDAMLSRTGYHTTSDFPILLEDVAKKNLRAAYEAAPQTWRPLAKLVSLTDFKPSRQVQIGDAPGLVKINEHGEFTHGTITEGKETAQLETYGRIFAITRQALINDDLNAFGDIPAAFGRKARDLESDLAWAEITTNPTMGDGLALFIAAHGNLSASSDAISDTSLGAARAALRVQKGLDGLTLLNLQMQYLIVPAAKETIAEKQITQITAQQASNVNPFAPGGRTPLTLIVEPRLDVASTLSWYAAVGAASGVPVLYYGVLDGNEGPDVRQVDGFDVDGVKFRARLDTEFKAADFRSIFKNPGA